MNQHPDQHQQPGTDTQFLDMPVLYQFGQLSRVHQAVQDELAVLHEDEQLWRLDEAKRAARVLDEDQMLWGARLPWTVEKAADLVAA